MASTFPGPPSSQYVVPIPAVSAAHSRQGREGEYQRERTSEGDKERRKGGREEGIEKELEGDEA